MQRNNNFFLSMQIKKVKTEISEISSNPQGLLLEAIHSAGYTGALANPLMASESSVHRLDSTVLEEFIAVLNLLNRHNVVTFNVQLQCHA